MACESEADAAAAAADAYIDLVEANDLERQYMAYQESAAQGLAMGAWWILQLCLGNQGMHLEQIQKMTGGKLTLEEFRQYSAWLKKHRSKRRN